MNVEKIVLKFFKSKGSFPGHSNSKYLDCNYIEAGLIDSMQLVEMIVFFENEFKIKFTNKDLQSIEFRIIGGLINIINRHLATK